MSPQLQYEMGSTRQHQPAGSTKTHHTATTDLLRRSRVGRAVVGVGVCLAALAAVTVTGAQGHVTQASQMNRQIHAFEAKGYAPVACTHQGTLMRDSHTGRFVTVRY